MSDGACDGAWYVVQGAGARSCEREGEKELTSSGGSGCAFPETRSALVRSLTQVESATILFTQQGMLTTSGLACMWHT